MPYTARDWANGELVTAEDLNRIERGINATNADVAGLADRLAALNSLGYDSGVRDISGAFQNGWTGAVTLGRAGNVVTVHFETLNSGSSTSSVVVNLPSGFRPRARPGDRVFRGALITSGAPTETYQLDIDRYGNVRVLVPATLGAKTVRGTIVFPTLDSPPTTPPGTPA